MRLYYYYEKINKLYFVFEERVYLNKEFNILIKDNFSDDSNLKKIKNKYAQMLCNEIFNNFNEFCSEEIIKILKNNI